MAVYFKYKTEGDLLADAERLGLEIDLAADLSPLFLPTEVGGHAVGNRCCVQPMEGCDGTLDGLPGELTVRRYQRFGAGGAKLIWGEATAISADGRMNSRQLWIHDRSAGPLAAMLAECRRFHRQHNQTDSDLLVGLQLTHSGRYSVMGPQRATRCPLLDPRTLDKPKGRLVRPDDPILADADLMRIENEFIAAARLARNIGCDFIDIKQCHRYLLSELLGARNRPGLYGGTFENRTRFVRNVVAGIRAAVPDLILASRFNTFDSVPFEVGPDRVGVPSPFTVPVETSFGVDPLDPLTPDWTEPIALAQALVAAGISLLNVSLGNPYANPHYVRPADYPPVDGYQAPEHPLIGVCRHFEATRVIQQAVPGIPVVGSGYSWLQAFALQAGAANVTAGHCHFVGMGRATLSQPDFANWAREHHTLDRKRTCRTFSYCTNLMRAKDHPLGQYATGCPPFDKEIYGPLWKEVEMNYLSKKTQDFPAND